MNRPGLTAPPMPVPVAVPDSPYKGLMPFDESDAAYFFGRDNERRMLCANLLASKLTVVYGASGAGKSSVLRAGAAFHLRGLARAEFEENGHCDHWVIVHRDWRDEPLAAIERKVREELVQSGLLAAPSEVPGRRLGDTLVAWAGEARVTLLLIFDQFEEYFMYHAPTPAADLLGPELNTLQRDRLGGCHVMLSLREDMLGMLDRMRASMPNVLENALRIRALDRESAALALTKPLEVYSERTGKTVTIEPALVDAVLQQIRSSELEPSRPAAAAAPPIEVGAKIEAPYLQLVMQRIWSEEQRQGSPVLRLDTLKGLGGAQRIVQSHLDTVMAGLTRRERSQAARLLEHLVTPLGTKIAHSVNILAALSHQKTDAINPLLVKLSSFQGILRALPALSGIPEEASYEIAHDALGTAVNAWRARHRAQRRRRLIWTLVATLLLMPSALGLVIGCATGEFGEILLNPMFHLYVIAVLVVVGVPLFGAGVWFGIVLKRTA